MIISDQSSLKYITMRYFLLIIMTVLLSSCGSDDKFTVNGRLADNSTINLRVLYMADGRLNTMLMASDRGSFAFEGHTTVGTVVEVLTNDYKPIGRFYVTPGDKLDVTLNPKAPSRITVTGNETAARWATWTTDNAAVLDSRDHAKANDLIARYVKAHRDDIVSTLLMVYDYDSSLDPAKANELLNAIAPEARPEALVAAYNTLNADLDAKTMAVKVVPFDYVVHGDTTRRFVPRDRHKTLLVFSDDHSGRSDSIVTSLRDIHRRLAGNKNAAILDLSLDNDTVVWTRSTKPDSAAWRQGWLSSGVGGSAISRLVIPRVPFFIVVDSAGRQVYRGSSLKAASKAIL